MITTDGFAVFAPSKNFSIGLYDIYWISFKALAMELRRLRYFVSVAESLNFTVAARKLGIAQPPLSVQIRKLESELGVALFDRTNRKIQLTAAGKLFFQDAKNLLAAADGAVQNLQDTVNGRIGTIAIRYTGCAFSETITRRMRKFIRKHRGIRIKLEPIDYKNVTSYALSNYDACIHDVTSAEKIPGIILEKAAVLIAVSPKHRLATNCEIRPADLLGENVLLSSPDRRSAAERLFASLLEDLNIATVVAPSNLLERLWQASLGLGVTVCSSSDRSATDAVLKPLAGGESEITTVLTPNPNSRAAGLSAFVDFIQA